MAVRIRMKPMGRKHRAYYRIVAIDGRQPNDGRVIEELGTYDPQVAGQRQERHPAGRPDQVLAVGRGQVVPQGERAAEQVPGPVRGQAAAAAGRGREEGLSRPRERAMRFDVLTLFPEMFSGYPVREHPQAGHDSAAWSRSTPGTSATGRPASTRGGRPAVRRRARHGDDAGPGLRLCRGRPGDGRAAGRAGHAHPGRRAADAAGGRGAGDASRGCSCCAAGTRGLTSGFGWG